MSKLIKLAILGILIQIIAILSFIGVAKTIWAVPGKQIIITIFIVAMSYLFVVAMQSLSINKLLLKAIFLTIAFVSAYGIIGFAFFPGLVKDLVPLSFKYFTGFGGLTIIVFCGYMGLIFIIWVTRKLLKF